MIVSLIKNIIYIYKDQLIFLTILKIIFVMTRGYEKNYFTRGYEKNYFTRGYEMKYFNKIKRIISYIIIYWFNFIFIYWFCCKWDVCHKIYHVMEQKCLWRRKGRNYLGGDSDEDRHEISGYGWDQSELGSTWEIWEEGIQYLWFLDGLGSRFRGSVLGNSEGFAVT